MSSLQNQKRRIKSITNTLDIANAMELVSSVKLKKLKSYYLGCKEYFIEKNNAIKEALSGLELQSDRGEEQWYVILSSSLGLCGNYNNEIEKILNEVDFNGKKIIVLGDNGINYFREKNIEVEKIYSEYNELTSDEISDFFIKRRQEGLLKTIDVVYTNYINNFVYKAKNEQIYPCRVEGKETGEYMLETSIEALISMYIKDCFEKIFLESILSENASRNMAMHQACDNASELRDELILIYNKTRQQQITDEIRDIVSGGE